MQAAALAPSEPTYGALLHACAKAGDAAGAERLIAAMRAAGVPPGVLAFTSLAHACVQCGTEAALARAFEARARPGRAAPCGLCAAEARSGMLAARRARPCLAQLERNSMRGQRQAPCGS
jgi:pentatricopeptide repeat protein